MADKKTHYCIALATLYVYCTSHLYSWDSFGITDTNIPKILFP